MFKDTMRQIGFLTPQGKGRFGWSTPKIRHWKLLLLLANTEEAISLHIKQFWLLVDWLHSDSLSFATVPLRASLGHLLGQRDRLPPGVVKQYKVRRLLCARYRTRG